MQLLEQDLFLRQPYAYCSHIGRIQTAYDGIFTTDNYGFRRSYFNNRPISYLDFINISQRKIWIAGNSVPYGVAVQEDKLVFHNVLSRNYCIPGYNLSIRASTIYQDFVCMARLVEGPDIQSVIWVAGLNDIIAMMAGNFSHPFFPPWFGEHRLLTPQWQRPTLKIDFNKSIELLYKSIVPIMQKTSSFANILFVWQPLWSERISKLSTKELSNIHLFMQTQGGSLAKIYASKQLAEGYNCLKSWIHNHFELRVGSDPSQKKIRFLDLSQSLPKGCLADVTHLNSKGHAWLAHQVYYHMNHL